MKDFLAANWKMNKTVGEAKDFFAAFLPAVKDAGDVDIVIAPSFTALAASIEAAKGSNVVIAAQDVYYEEKGAYTGEVSPQMLVDLGCRQVIVGHSERRQYFGETDSILNRKCTAAQKAGLGVIFCVGESLEERESGKTFDVIRREIEQGLEGVDSANLVVAYEPIWAIGTGKTATPEQAQEVHAFIRSLLVGRYGGTAAEIRILYGGSVTPENVDQLMAQPDINGALVGGASLKAESFSRIVCYQKEK